MDIDFLAVQETKIKTTNEIEINEFQNTEKTHTLYHTTADPKGQGGVGILLKNKFKKIIKSKKSISPRILSITLMNNPEITIISVYSPTNESEDEAKKTFYDQLSEYITSLPKHNLIVIAGDLNTLIVLYSNILVPRNMERLCISKNHL